MALLALLPALPSCEGQNTFKEDLVMAGNLHVPAGVLNSGKRIYTEHCMACHGEGGRGDGPAARGLDPPPRDFTLGIIKFGDVPSGDLPHDGVMKEHLARGLAGTAMLPWDLSEAQAHAVVQYVKTFAPDVWVGADKEVGRRVAVTRDPYGTARRASAVERGKTVYHVTANCQTCHQAYVTKEELARLTNAEEGTTDSAAADFGDDIYATKPQESEHGRRTVPPDFTWHEMRSVRSIDDLYLRIAAGVGGTTMVAWRDGISDADIWAVAHYVQSLADLKGTEARRELVRALESERGGGDGGGGGG